MLRLLIAATILLVPVASAEAGGFFDLGPDPLAQFVRSLEPQGPPEPGALDALADVSASFARTKNSSVDHELEEATILHAIALSERSGIPIALDEVTDVEDLAARESESSRAVALEADEVLSALALGMPRVDGAVEDVLTKTRRYTTSDRTSVAVDITEEDTFGGLALMARGIELDPHDLIHVDASSSGSSRTKALAGLTPDPRYRQNVTFPRDTAVAAAPILGAGGPIEPSGISDMALRTSDGGSLSRANTLPEEVVLAAIAFNANGMPVDADDVMSKREDKRVTRIGQVETGIDRATVTGVLLLGAGTQ